MPKVLLTELESCDLGTLLAVAERIAVARADGHLTIMRFTTGWKCMLGTPSLDGDGRSEVSALPSLSSAREALMSVVCS